MGKTGTLAVLLFAVVLVYASASTATAQQMDIVDTAAANSNFSTLVTAIRATGLEYDLKGRGPFTVFAPTNDAFARLPRGTLDNLLRPENRQVLRSILLYHVVPGRVTSADVLAMPSPNVVTTLNRQGIRLTHGRAGVLVNDAMVIQPDIRATNGVIHAIDRVLLPSNLMIR